MRLVFFSSPKFWVFSCFVVFSISSCNPADQYVAFIFTFKLLLSACSLRDEMIFHQSSEPLL